MNIMNVLPQFQLSLFEEDNKPTIEVTDGLSERQKLVYKTLKELNQGATAKELSVTLHNEGKVMSNERNSVHPRLNELLHLGLVEVVGKKTCSFTDKKVSIYKTI